MKKILFLSFFIMLALSSIGHASNYRPAFYETLRLANINFDDHLQELDLFIAKWKPLEKPIQSQDLLGRDKILYYKEPQGIAGDIATTTVVYENAKYISLLLIASRRPLVGIKKCYDQNEESLSEEDAISLNDAITALGTAYDIIRNYGIRIYNLRQSYQDLSDLHATRAKIVEGQAKLQEILSRRTTPESTHREK